jgi:Tol biopolymer transport system component
MRDVLPQFLPDGRHFIYKRASSDPGNTGIYLGSLDAKPEEQSRKPLLPSLYGAVYVPSATTDSGHLLFVREGTLLAQPFDARRMQSVDDPVAVAEGLGTFIDFAFFSAATDGALVYRTGSGGFQGLAWFDRQGKTLGTAGEPAAIYLSLCLSPDGARAAVGRISSQSSIPAIWLLDFSRGTSTRFTFGSSGAEYAVWSPDGTRLILASNQSGVMDLYQKSASGATDEQLLLKSTEDKFPTSWSRVGRLLLYTAEDPETKADLWVLPLEGDKKPFPFLRTEFNEQDGQFSPDGRWVAYSSDESGRMEVYVRPFSKESTGASGTGGKWLISNGGGSNPRWRGDGRELYYTALDEKLTAVEVTTNPVFQAGVPKALFQAPVLFSSSAFGRWDVTADGKRFLFGTPAAQSAQVPFTVLLNWEAALKK